MHRHKIIFFGLLAFFILGCKKPFEPPAITARNNFLVVNGVINGSAGGETYISLSRSRSLADTIEFIPETAAQIHIVSDHNVQYMLEEIGNGHYKSQPLSLDHSRKYRLHIKTSNGKRYTSELETIVQTPPIDSLNWQQEDDVTIFVNTHDPQNKTRYYRWDFEETWEYHATYETVLEFVNGQVQFRDPSNYVYKCWNKALSTNILIASTVKLSNDKIEQFPIAVVKRNSPKISVRYSILVKQYALTPRAYEYWKILKKNTEELGTLFDAQPAQLFGNIRNIEDRSEPVIGYITASTIQEKRMFIRESEVQKEPGQEQCFEFIVQPSEAALYLQNRPDLAPAYNVTGGGLVIAKTSCVDCRTKGGTTTRPSFW